MTSPTISAWRRSSSMEGRARVHARADPMIPTRWSTASAERRRSPSASRRSCCCVDPASGSSRTCSSRLVPRVDPPAGTVMHDVYEALVETALADQPPTRSRARARSRRCAPRCAPRAARRSAPASTPPSRSATRRTSSTSATRVIGDQMRGLLRRTPTCALHVHVGMPDPETAIRAFNRMRAAAAGAAGARRPLAVLARDRLGLRDRPRAAVPRLPARRHPARVRRLGRLRGRRWTPIVAAAGVEDYTFLWWDLRPHPKLGTLEVRAMDAQARLGSVLRPRRARPRARARPPRTSRTRPRARRARCSSSPPSAPAATGSTRRSGTTARCGRCGSDRRRARARAPPRPRRRRRGRARGGRADPARRQRRGAHARGARRGRDAARPAPR